MLKHDLVEGLESCCANVAVRSHRYLKNPGGLRKIDLQMPDVYEVESILGFCLPLVQDEMISVACEHKTSHGEALVCCFPPLLLFLSMSLPLFLLFLS